MDHRSIQESTWTLYMLHGVGNYRVLYAIFRRVLYCLTFCAWMDDISP